MRNEHTRCAIPCKKYIILLVLQDRGWYFPSRDNRRALPLRQCTSVVSGGKIRLFAPIEFDLAKAHSITNLDTSVFESLCDAHSAERYLQTIHALFILRVGHINSTLDTFAVYHVDTFLLSDSKGVFRLWVQYGTIRISHDLVRCT